MPLKLYRRGKIWHFSVSVEGNRLRRSTGTTEKELAKRVAAETEAKLWKRHLDGPEAGVTMAHVFATYIDAGKPDRFLDQLIDFWKDQKIPSPKAIQESARKIYPDAAAATWNRQVITPTQAAINHTLELLDLPTIRVKRFRVEKKAKTPATPEWVAAFSAQATDDGLPHLAALCQFMFGTGARIGEALALSWEDLDLEGCTALVRQTKVGAERVAHLPQPLVVTLANIPSNRNPDATVFGYVARDSVRKTWDNVIERAGIERLTAHSCRHGFATVLMRRGVDIKTIAKLGGWKDVRTLLEIYVHASEDTTLTEGIFDTNLAQGTGEKAVSYRKQMGKLA
ncbi:MAG: site-specific integrase [Rhodobacteraceae bacterium]|nr:site-specific integrase [Paracoccaceae bacterium]